MSLGQSTSVKIEAVFTDEGAIKKMNEDESSPGLAGVGISSCASRRSFT
jgi:hypothetical protein